MKFSFIHKSDNSSKLLLIFAGWSTDDNFYRQIHRDGWDIAVVWDYTNFFFNYQEHIKRYSTVFLVAWSLGVAAAEFIAHAGYLTPSLISEAFAINGTSLPVSDQYGIPANIFNGTENNLSVRNLVKFQRRMTSRDDKFYPFPVQSLTIEPDIDNLRVQLRNFLNIEDVSPVLPWRRIYISKNDHIFPASSQSSFWNKFNLDIIELNAGHYIPLQDIISEITPNSKRIGERFMSAARNDYDSNAFAQKKIAANLVGMIPEDICHGIENFLEIGTGSGIFSKLLAERTNPSSATFIDLFEIDRLNLVPQEYYFAQDAEEWMEYAEPGSFDLIASASTIQWFSNPKRFFENSNRILRKCGYLLCSSFLPGNLKELDILRPSPLLYRSFDELKKYAEKFFDIISISYEEIVLRFTSRREMLVHLKKTGVGGSSIHASKNISFLPEKPQLTYIPIYMFLKKKEL